MQPVSSKNDSGDGPNVSKFLQSDQDAMRTDPRLNITDQSDSLVMMDQEAIAAP